MSATTGNMDFVAGRQATSPPEDPRPPVSPYPPELAGRLETIGAPPRA